MAATGGSTNAVLHLLAIAREAGVDLDLPDFDRVSARTPLIADLKPSGRFVATDLHAAGGSPLVVKRLIDSGKMAGDALTVTGHTLAEDAAKAIETPGQQVVRPNDRPIKPHGGLVILFGNLAPEGAVLKLSGTERADHRGPARVFDSEEQCFDAVQRQTIKPGDVVVIRYEGPAGGPGMREMLAVTAAITGAGLGESGTAPDRRPLFRCDAGPFDRPYRAGSVARRTDRRHPRGRHDHARRREAHAERRSERRRDQGAPRRLAGARAEIQDRRHGEIRTNSFRRRRWEL